MKKPTSTFFKVVLLAIFISSALESFSQDTWGLSTALAELEAYINQNKHLPEVPSAREMEANGLNLKEINLLLLKKVEELTLHLIEQDKKIKELRRTAGERKPTRGAEKFVINLTSIFVNNRFYLDKTQRYSYDMFIF